MRLPTKLYWLSLVLSLVPLAGAAQNVNPKTSKHVGPEEYNNIEGTPFLYQEWLASEVISASGVTYTEAKANFNGYTQGVAYYLDNEIKEMLEGSYLKVSFLTAYGKQTLRHGLHPDLGTDLALLVFDGESIDLVKTFVVTIQEYSNTTATARQFVTRIEYYLIQNNRLSRILLKKKKILAALQDKSVALEKYIASENLNLKKEAAVIQLLEFYEAGKK